MSTLTVRSKIKTMRETRGISQSQMAEKLQMDERNYKRIESGEKKTIDIDLLSRIAEVLEVDIPELLTTEVMNVHNGNNTEINAPVGYGSEITINNNFPADLKKVYDDLVLELKEVIAEKNRTIDLLRELKGK